jgi:hypothetical protein
MKTKSIKIKGILFLIGAIILNTALTSCSSGKIFTGKMKYTYYKKVKAQSRKDSTINITRVEPEEMKRITSPQVSALQDSNSTTQNFKSPDTIAVTTTRSSSVITGRTETKSAKGPETKKNKVKRIFNEKLKSFTSSKSNTKDANGSRGSVLGTIVLVLLAILLAYILIVLLFIGLMNAMGGMYMGEF